MSKLLDAIVKAIDDKKGGDIVSLDLRGIDGAVCDYFVVCSAASTVQVAAIAGGVEDDVFENLAQKVNRIHGLQNSLWVAMDYGDIMVHIFQDEMRDYYRLEELWADGKIKHYESNQ